MEAKRGKKPHQRVEMVQIEIRLEGGKVKGKVEEFDGAVITKEGNYRFRGTVYSNQELLDTNKFKTGVVFEGVTALVSKAVVRKSVSKNTFLQLHDELLQTARSLKGITDALGSPINLEGEDLLESSEPQALAGND